jgi:Glycosyl hydrolase family 26
MRSVRLAIVLLLALAPAARAASPTATLGVYAGGGAAAKVAAFERWNGGRHAAYALDFLPMGSWHELAHPDWWAARWRGTRHRVIFSVPLLPRSGGSLTAGARGAYDARFASMARTLVVHGQGHAILRVGWEFNGDWFPWAAGRDPSAFVAYWRRVVRAIRGVPGANFTIDWAPNLGRGAVAPDSVYPCDPYVDVIGMDAYDMGWGEGWQDPARRWASLVEQPYGLAWQRRFAAAHGKPTSIPEWGMIVRPDGHGGGDDPYYVRHMHAWIASGNVLYHDYFEFDSPDGRHRMMNGEFPAGAAAFRRLFGPRA